MRNEETENLNLMDNNSSNVSYEQSNINDRYMDTSPIVGPFQIRDKRSILIVIIMLVLGIVFFYNFKPRKLNCTLSHEISGITTTLDFNFTFSGKTPKKLNMIAKANLDNHIEYKDAILNGFETAFGNQMNEINNRGGKATISSTDDSVIFEVSSGKEGIDVMLSAGGRKVSYDGIKKEFEDIGYICK